MGPSSASSASRVTPPGRSRMGSAPVRSSTVDSSPIGQRPACQDQADAGAQDFPPHARRGRADGAGAVGAGCGDRTPHGSQQRAGHGMVGDPHRDRVETGAGQQATGGCRGGAAAPGSAVPARSVSARLVGPFIKRTTRFRSGQVGDVDDQRVEAAAGPWPRRCWRPRGRRWHRRPGRRPSRSGRPPARPRAAGRPRARCWRRWGEPVRGSVWG